MHKKAILLALIQIIPLLSCAQERTPAEQVRALMESCQFSQAASLAEHFLDRDSTDTGLLLLEGKSLAALSKYPEAIRVLESAHRADSSSIPILNELVQTYRQSGNFNGAVRTARIAAALYPGNPWFRLQTANLLFASGEYRQAVPLLLDLYRDDSTSFHVARQLGACYNELRRTDSAIRFYRRALKLVPFDENVTGRLTNLYIRTDEIPMALYITQRFLEHDSTCVPVLRQNGYCLYLLIDFGGAARQLEKCLRLGDSSKFTNKYLGLAYYKQAKYDTAAPYFREAFRSDTNDAEVCFYYGVSANRAGQSDTGRAYLERTLRLLMPESGFLSSLYAELADASTTCGDPDTAIFLLKKALEANPDNNTLRFRLAYQYDFHLRKPFEGLPWYREFLKNDVPGGTNNNLLPQHLSYHDYTVRRIREIAPKQK